MMQNAMVLGENAVYSLDCYQTQLNNNVLVVGASGSGKTRGIVTPNLLMTNGRGTAFLHFFVRKRELFCQRTV